MKADFSCFFVIINLKSIFGRKNERKKQQRDSLSGSLSTVVGDEKLTSREDLIGLLFFYV